MLDSVYFPCLAVKPASCYKGLHYSCTICRVLSANNPSHFHCLSQLSSLDRSRLRELITTDEKQLNWTHDNIVRIGVCMAGAAGQAKEFSQ